VPGQPGEPGGAVVRQPPAQERTELFAAMLEESTDKKLCLRGEDKGHGFAHQMQ
jgi:hypothetical protein